MNTEERNEQICKELLEERTMDCLTDISYLDGSGEIKISWDNDAVDRLVNLYND